MSQHLEYLEDIFEVDQEFNPLQRDLCRLILDQKNEEFFRMLEKNTFSYDLPFNSSELKGSACLVGNTTVLNYLLKFYPNLNVNYALHLYQAAATGHFDALELLLNKGAKLDFLKKEAIYFSYPKIKTFVEEYEKKSS